MLSDGNKTLEGQIKLWRESIKPVIDKALDIVPEDKLDWAPAEGMISLGQIFLHIAECSDWWYDEVMKNNKSVELAVGACPPKEKIAGHMDDHWRRLDRFFAERAEVLAGSYSFDHEGKSWSFDGSWIFTHLFEHDLHHRSQINQYLRILGLTPPKA